MNKLTIIVLLLIVSSIQVKAQQITTDSTTTKPKAKDLFYNAGMQYMSNLTYAGRRDESSVPILLPSFTLVTKHGLFISGIGYFDVNGSKSGAEGLSVTAGDVFAFDSKKLFGGNISATKYFITANSPIILSSFNASIDGQLYANPGNIIKLTVGVSYRIDKQNANDIINSAELSKEIFAVKTGAAKTNGLKLTPTLTAYSGTQSFYQTYYTSSVVQREVQSPGSSSPISILFPGQPQQTVVNETVTQEKQEKVKKYDLLAIGASMPVSYVINKWQISFTPYFIKPYNQVNYINNTPMNGIYFLFTLGASVTF